MTLRKSRKILVLGELASASVLGRHFEAAGFKPIYQAHDSTLPRIGRRDYKTLREVLMRFSKESGGEGLVHPGVTSWAERPELQTLGQEAGLTVIAPSAKILSLFDNKLSFLLEAEKLGIDNLVQSYDPLSSIREIQRFIRKTRQTFPFVIKSAKGGGHFGVYVLHGPQSVGPDLTLWFEQLRWNLGEVILFPEKYLEGSRHFSVPFVRFNTGKIQIFPIVDGSLQSRYRKVLEYCPPFRVDADVLEKITRWTKAFAESCHYVGLGTLEFLVDGGRAFLVGGQARLNTSFHLWEEVAGTSALSWQLAALSPEGVRVVPTAVVPKSAWRQGASLRIYAEDSLFHLPQPGLVVEVASNENTTLSVEEGKRVSSLDTGLLGVTQVLAENSEQLHAALNRALEQVWISGSLQTNERFLSELLNHPWVREGIFHTGFVDEEFLPQVLPGVEDLEIFAAVCAWFFDATRDLSVPLSEAQRQEDQESRWMVGERWVKTRALLKPLSWEGEPSVWSRYGFRGVSGRVQIEGRPALRVCATLVSNRWLVRLGNWFMPVRRLPPKSQIEARTLTQRRLVALVSGRVHAVLFRKGVWISTHESILVLESFGVFVPHALPMEVRIVEWKVSHDEVVSLGQELALLEVRRTVPTSKKAKEDEPSPGPAS